MISTAAALGGESAVVREPAAKRDFESLPQSVRDALAVFMKVDSEWRVCTAGFVSAFVLVRLFRHVHPASHLDLWHVLLSTGADLHALCSALQRHVLEGSFPVQLSRSLDLMLSHMVEMLIFCSWDTPTAVLSVMQTPNAQYPMRWFGQPWIYVRTASPPPPPPPPPPPLLLLHYCIWLRNKARTDVIPSGRTAHRGCILLCMLWRVLPWHPQLQSRIDAVLAAALYQTKQPSSCFFCFLCCCSDNFIPFCSQRYLRSYSSLHHYHYHEHHKQQHW